MKFEVDIEAQTSSQAYLLYNSFDRVFMNFFIHPSPPPENFRLSTTNIHVIHRQSSNPLETLLEQLHRLEHSESMAWSRFWPQSLRIQ